MRIILEGREWGFQFRSREWKMTRTQTHTHVHAQAHAIFPESSGVWNADVLAQRITNYLGNIAPERLRSRGRGVISARTSLSLWCTRRNDRAQRANGEDKAMATSVRVGTDPKKWLFYLIATTGQVYTMSMGCERFTRRGRAGCEVIYVRTAQAGGNGEKRGARDGMWPFLFLAVLGGGPSSC